MDDTTKYKSFSEIKDALSQVGIALQTEDTLRPFNRQGSSIFSHIPEHPGMYTLIVTLNNPAYEDCEARLNGSDLTVHFYGTWWNAGSRIVVIS